MSSKSNSKSAVKTTTDSKIKWVELPLDDSKAVRQSYEERRTQVSEKLAVQSAALTQVDKLEIGGAEYLAAKLAVYAFDHANTQGRVEQARAAVIKAHQLPTLWKLDSEGNLTTGFDVLKKAVNWLKGIGSPTHGQLRYVVSLVAYVGASENGRLPARGELSNI